MLETADRLVAEEKEPSVQQFLLLVGGLRAMAAGERAAGPGARLLPAALAGGGRLRAVVRALRPLRRCEGPHRWFNPSMGGMLCATCRVPGSASPAPETVAVLGALLAGDWPVVEAADPRHLREASGLVVGVPRLAPRAGAALAGVRRALGRRRRGASVPARTKNAPAGEDALRAASR